MKKYIFLTVLMLLILCVSAEAADFVFRYSPDVPSTGDDLFPFGVSDDEELMKDLLAKGVIEYYEPDAVFSLPEYGLGSGNEVAAVRVPVDILYHMYQMSYEYKLTNAVGIVNNTIPFGEYIGIRGQGVRIGIIDTGIIQDHPWDIDYGKIVAQRDITKNTDTAIDTVGHGTAVAGIIAAMTGNSDGVASLAPEAELVIVKVFQDNTYTVQMSDVLAGLRYAVEQGCDVINLSLGSTDNGNTMRSINEVIKSCAEKGVIVVAAAGNHSRSGTNADKPNKNSPLWYPAALKDVISVGAVNSSGERAWFSYHNSSVDVTACGDSVIVLDWLNCDTAYKLDSGTSFAAPFVASVAALAKQIKPELTVDEFRDILAATSTDVGAPGRDNYYGYGIINVEGIFEYMLPPELLCSGTVRVRMERDNTRFSSIITNSGAEAVRIMDIWTLEETDDLLQLKTAVIEPGQSTMIDFSEEDEVVCHMVWNADTLEPLCEKEIYITNAWEDVG